MGRCAASPPPAASTAASRRATASRTSCRPDAPSGRRTTPRPSVATVRELALLWLAISVCVFGTGFSMLPCRRAFFHTHTWTAGGADTVHPHRSFRGLPLLATQSALREERGVLPLCVD